MANNKNRHRRFTPPPAKVEGDKEVLSRSIDSLNLPEETLALLKNNKFETVYDIARRTERDMFRIQTFNKRHLLAVQRAINAVGISFLPFVPKDKPEEERQADNKQQPSQQKQNRNEGRQQGAKPADNRARQQDNHNNNNGNGNARSQQNGAKPQQNNAKPQQNNAKPQPPREERKPRVELPLEEWEKVQKKGKWGFSNGLNIVIQPQFDEVFSFKDGLACVDVGDKFGYIDKSGEFVIVPQYECAMSFSEGLAVFFEGEKCGYINKQNEVVISAKFDAATSFVDGRAKVKEAGKWQTIDMEGNVLWSK